MSAIRSGGGPFIGRLFRIFFLFICTGLYYNIKYKKRILQAKEIAMTLTKRFGVIISILAAFLFLAAALPESGFAADNSTLRILFTQDLHSRELPFNMMLENGSVSSVGGYARIKTLIDQNKTDETIVLDGGDYSQGSLFNSIFTSKGSDLALLGAMGYDAVTLGNHEFDFGTASLASSISASKSSGSIPQILAANIQYSDDGEAQNLKSVIESNGGTVKIFEKNGVKIGVFGIMGKTAGSEISSNGISFSDPEKAARECVKTLQNQGANVIICLSHSGTDADSSRSEDEKLARDVKGIDVIISAHSHRVIDDPITVGSTTIVSSGCYGEYLGCLDYDISSKSVDSYKLISVDNSVDEDQEIADKISGYKNDVQTSYLDAFDYQFDQVIAKSNKNFMPVSDLQDQYGNSDIANFVTDAYSYSVGQWDDSDSTPIGITAAGLIRNTIVKGDITFSDAFSIASVGTGSDGSIGSPMLEGYLTGADLRKLCELDAFIGKSEGAYQLYFSGLRYSINASRLPMNRVVTLEAQDKNGSWQAVNDDDLYLVTMNSIASDQFSRLNSMTHGLFKVQLRNKDGEVISNLSDAVLKNEDGRELKDWYTIVNYLQSFEKDDSGVPVISASYNDTRVVKQYEDNTLQSFFENTSIYGRIEYAVGAALIVIIIAIIIGVVRHSKKKSQGRENSGKEKF